MISGVGATLSWRYPWASSGLHTAAVGGHAGVGALQGKRGGSGIALHETVRENWKPILQIAGLVVIHNVGFYIVSPTVHLLPTYLGFSTTAAFVDT